MIFGLPPFGNKNKDVMIRWIIELEPSFPEIVKISDELKDLIIKCL